MGTCKEEGFEPKLLNTTEVWENMVSSQMFTTVNSTECCAVMTVASWLSLKGCDSNFVVFRLLYNFNWSRNQLQLNWPASIHCSLAALGKLLLLQNGLLVFERQLNRRCVCIELFQVVKCSLLGKKYVDNYVTYNQHTRQNNDSMIRQYLK